MAVIIKDLGMVTAYAYAVSKGYTGTEDEFAELMASYADVAEQAAESAEQAAASERNAQTYSQTAVDKALEASGYATTAANKASEAAASASSASGSAATATQKASDASASATAAANSESAAAGSATNAGNSASAAASSATAANTAQTAAETAQGKAEDAQEAAETAATNAQTAAAEVLSVYQGAYPHDTASGSIAHLEDGAALPVRDLSVDIEPVQNLNGYDNPWPAGGGKNLLPPFASPSFTVEGVTLTNNNGEYTLNGTTGSNVAVFDISVSLPAGQYTVAVNNPIANSKVQIYGIDVNGAVPLQVLCSTANATATATFSAAVKTFRIRVLTNGTVDNFKLSPVFSAGATAATQFYPYSNICPISGWTGCKVTRTGRNLFSSVIGRWLWSNGVRYANTTGQYCGTNDKIPIKGGETYFLSITNTARTTAIYISFFNGETFLENLVKWNVESFAFTAPENANYAAISFSNADAYTGDPTVSNAMLNIGSTAETYEPYQGETYTIQLGGTRYGGTLDVTAGKLTVDRAMVDMGTLNWGGWTDSVGYIFNAPVSGRLQTRINPAISSQYTWNPYVSVWADLVNGQMTGQVGGANVYVRDTRYASIEDFKAGVSGVQLVYPLATPIVYDLDPVTVSTLLGTNNIFADCGDTTVDYYADPTLYINRKIAAAVAAMS